MGRFPYDVSKSCADLISLSYFHTYGLPIAVTRCGNLFGPGDLNNNRLIPGTIESVLQNQTPVIRSNGKFIRDYFFVKDAAHAYLRLAERLPGVGVTGEAFNFGTEQPLSVIDVVSKILDLMDRRDLEPTILHQATHEIERQYLDCSKARRVLNWTPEYSFEEGLAQTVAWYSNRAGALKAAAV
jgi:CDP-glucose 4,6-dehydratase